jgi:putative membrane protein
MIDQMITPNLLSLDLNYWALQTIAMMITAFLIPGLQVNGPFGALLTVVGLAFVNTKVWDAALFLSVPNTITVQAATLILVNGAIFWILVKILPGIEVQGIVPAIAAPIIFSICSVLISQHGKDIEWKKIGQAVAAEFGELRGQFKAEGSQPEAPAATSHSPTHTHQ